MSVRRRTWKTNSGELREAWVVDYVDQAGDRHVETYDRKRDADRRHAAVLVDVSQGTHTAASKSLTLAEAADEWLHAVEHVKKRERTTVVMYQQHLDNHILPRLGDRKLSNLTTPACERFAEQLQETLSLAMARKVLVTFKTLLRYARRHGQIAFNPAEDTRIERDPRRESNGKLEIGVHIPTFAEVAAMINAVRTNQRLFTVLLTAAWTGLRASELRGLRWCDIGDKEIRVRQRADRYGEIGDLKSATSRRNIPVPSVVIAALRQWRLECPKGELVFPGRNGGPMSLDALVGWIFQKAQKAAGILENGKPKYSGIHSMRHYFASLCINTRAKGGLELSPKEAQHRLGHATLQMTMDRYGHLFPAQSDDGALDALASQMLRPVRA
jgi:integrase